MSVCGFLQGMGKQGEGLIEQEDFIFFLGIRNKLFLLRNFSGKILTLIKAERLSLKQFSLPQRNRD